MSKHSSCPFCGSKENQTVTDDGIGWVKCNGCGATGPIFSKYSGEEDREYISWESRAEAQALREEVARSEQHRNDQADLIVSLRTEVSALRARVVVDEHAEFERLFSIYKMKRHNHGAGGYTDFMTHCVFEAFQAGIRLNGKAVSEGELAALRKDKERLDAIEGNYWDVRYDSSPNADAGDSSISIEIIGHYQGAPHVRVLGENYTENLRAAIDQAMTAEAYPPERPEYDDHGRPLRALLGEGKET